MDVFHTPPCCTGNQARLLPNWIHHQWLQTADGGLAAALYGPNRVTATVRGGQKVRVVVDTKYPFEETIAMTVSLLSTAKTLDSHAGATFPLHLRIPGWCTTPTVTVNGVSVGPVTLNPLGFHVVAREWRSGDVVELTFPMEPVFTTAHTINNGGFGNVVNANRNNFVRGGLPYATVSLGPLLFALPLEKGEAWQYALQKGAALTVARTSMPAVWDWPYDAPVRITVTGVEMSWPDVWTMPSAPLNADAVNESKSVRLELVPYGCSKQFKVSMFPYALAADSTL
jgi:hypothetical protein